MSYVFKKDQTIFIDKLSHLMWDRTGVLTPNSDIVLMTPMGELKQVCFKALCEARAEQLANTNKKIYLYWSGGLDSTAVFLLLREVVRKDQLIILYTKNSLKEYPGFFEEHIQGVYEAKEFWMIEIGAVTNSACLDGIVVTGEISDQLFGSMLFAGLSPDKLSASWLSSEYKVLAEKYEVQEFIAQSPSEIRSLADLLWWFNYALKYQYVQVRMLLDNETSKLNENIFHFFDTKGFNDYAVSTQTDIKIPGYDCKNYKYPLRKLIARLSGDTDYAFSKPKVASWSPVYTKTHQVATAIDTNWVRYYESD